MASPRNTSPESAAEGCQRELRQPSDVGWECECGAVVCPDPDCFDEYFKQVAAARRRAAARAGW
jgi:hypothetical protein